MSEYDFFIIMITQFIRVNNANFIKIKTLFSNLIDESKKF